jgi:hypothetical protein
MFYYSNGELYAMLIKKFIFQINCFFTIMFFIDTYNIVAIILSKNIVAIIKFKKKIMALMVY